MPCPAIRQPTLRAHCQTKGRSSRRETPAENSMESIAICLIRLPSHSYRDPYINVKHVSLNRTRPAQNHNCPGNVLWCGPSVSCNLCSPRILSPFSSTTRGAAWSCPKLTGENSTALSKFLKVQRIHCFSSLQKIQYLKTTTLQEIYQLVLVIYKSTVSDYLRNRKKEETL